MPNPLSNGVPEAPRKVGRPKLDRDDRTVKVEARIALQVGVIARAKKIPVAEYLSDLIRDRVDQDFETCMRKRDESGDQ